MNHSVIDTSNMKLKLIINNFNNIETLIIYNYLKLN